jgi:hypothetical protein
MQAGAREQKEVRIDLRFGSRDFSCVVACATGQKMEKQSLPSNQRGHEGKNNQQDVVGSSRQTVSRREVLLGGTGSDRGQHLHGLGRGLSQVCTLWLVGLLF